MSIDLDSTIAALAAGSSGGYRQIVRISGTAAVSCLQRVLVDPPPGLDSAKGACRFPGRIALGDSRELPADIYLWPTSRSYTRQPLAELHLPGSMPLAGEVLSRLCAAGARVARPGEFTMRAFLAGRLDLAQAEAVLGLIDAQEETQFQTALTQLAGGLSGPLAEARRKLLELLAHLEAGLDFVEEDIEFISPEELRAGLAAIEATLQSIEQQMGTRETHNPVIKVALAGLPNAGKSSLFNALLQSDKAIVSDTAGTTRDYVVGELTIDELRFQFIDTAGMEIVIPSAAEGPAQEPGIEQAMQRQSQQVRTEADLVLVCLDTTQGLSPLDRQMIESIDPQRRIFVGTKCDLADSRPLEVSHLKTSAATGEGLESLKTLLAQAAVQLRLTHSQMVPGTAARCRDSLAGARSLVAEAMAGVGESRGEELIASDLRAALDQLAQVVGAVYTDHILDVIFSRFCIGK